MMIAQKKNKNLIVLSTGGTGGHIFPAQAIAEKLQSPKTDLQLICDERTLPFLNGIFLKIKIHIITSSIPRKSIVSKLITLSKLMFSTLKVLHILMKNRPKLIVSFGGYTSIPASLSAIILRIPLILHEQNSLLGQINRIFLPFARKLLTSFPNTQKINNKYKDKVLLTGLPLRNKITTFTHQSPAMGSNKTLKILVIGGSQGAKLFSDVIPNAIYSLDKTLQERIEITHQVRNNLLYSTEEVYKKTNCSYTVKSFFKNIFELYQKNDLIIIRAGASSIAELITFKKAAIVIPFAKAKNNHQYYNAKFLTEISGAIMQEEQSFNSNWLACQLKKALDNPKKFKNIEGSYNNKYTSLHINAAANIAELIRQITM
jgi:UDP-N-acetylglucosamine--N-acetylmuramyl-(pentapeptide) pyrophosphoryl-undecaprenol N-acetylglucosamine transferase